MLVYNGIEVLYMKKYRYYWSYVFRLKSLLINILFFIAILAAIVLTLLELQQNILESTTKTCIIIFGTLCRAFVASYIFYLATIERQNYKKYRFYSILSIIHISYILAHIIFIILKLWKLSKFKPHFSPNIIPTFPQKEYLQIFNNVLIPDDRREIIQPEINKIQKLLDEIYLQLEFDEGLFMALSLARERINAINASIKSSDSTKYIMLSDLIFGLFEGTRDIWDYIKKSGEPQKIINVYQQNETFYYGIDFNTQNK